jgi:hypothetical protein
MSLLPSHLQHLQHLKGAELKTAIQTEYYMQAVAFIVRQTDYSEDAAAERLIALKDPVKVVKEYLGLPESDAPETASSLKSKNQMKYGEIRKFMDEGAKQFNMQKELNERRRKYQEWLQSQQEQSQQEQSQQEQSQQEQSQSQQEQSQSQQEQSQQEQSQQSES